MPPLLDALRPWASWPGSAAKAPGLVAIPLVLGAACVLGSAAWVTGSLFAAVDPPREKAAVLSRLDDWPEIRNGVPDLKRAAPVPLPAVDVAPPPSDKKRAAVPERLPASRPDAPPMPAEAASAVHDEDAQQRPAPAAAAVPAPETENAGAVPAATSLLSSAPVSAPGVVPPAPRAPASVESGARPAKAPVAQKGRGGDRVDAIAPSRPSTSQRAPAPRRDGGAVTRTADARPAKPERGRTAASPQPSEEAAAPGGSAETAVAAVPESESVRLLGVPLPSGQKIKECLLQFRC